jgi:hypothetical protein
MTSLAQKLQIKPGKRWLIYNAPKGYLRSLEPLPEGATCTATPNGNFDGIQIFAKLKAELTSSLKLIAPFLKADTIFWVTYPKRSSGIESDLKMGGFAFPARRAGENFRNRQGGDQEQRMVCVY